MLVEIYYIEFCILFRFFEYDKVFTLVWKYLD